MGLLHSHANLDLADVTVTWHGPYEIEGTVWNATETARFSMRLKNDSKNILRDVTLRLDVSGDFDDWWVARRGRWGVFKWVSQPDEIFVREQLNPGIQLWLPILWKFKAANTGAGVGGSISINAYVKAEEVIPTGDRSTAIFNRTEQFYPPS